MTEEILSVIIFHGRFLTLKAIASVALFAGLLIFIYSFEAYLIFHLVQSRRKGQKISPLFKSKWAFIVHLLAIAGIICLLYGYFIEPYWIEVKRIEISTSKLHQSTIRLVQISDTHCTNNQRNKRKIIETIDSINPDVILFTGDSANSSKGLKQFKETMAELHAGLGKYGIKGNIEKEKWKGVDIFDGTGFIELDANSVEIKKDGDSFWITGITCEKERETNNVLKKIPAENYSIFLHHFPDLVEDLNSPVDLYLAGHTHGGQIALPFYGAIITLSKFGKKYEAGQYRVGNIILYVNRGIGLAAGFNPKVRFFARPEITVIDIHPEKIKSK